MNAAHYYNSASSDLFAKATVGGLVLINGIMRVSVTAFLICATSLVYHMDQELIDKNKPNPPELK
jgi:hypothetical protein